MPIDCLLDIGWQVFHFNIQFFLSDHRRCDITTICSLLVHVHKVYSLFEVDYVNQNRFVGKIEFV